jgi:hypothetical protein
MINIKHITIASILGLIITFFACKKYKDPVNPPLNNLTSKYCNNPKAINYNWGFPGSPDNSICIYPADLYAGSYIFYDSLLDASGLYLPFDTIAVTITKLNDSSISINGLCGTTNFTATALKNNRFNLDTTAQIGQIYCSGADTINGFATKWLWNDSNFKFTYLLINGVNIKEHKGYFIKQ